MAFLGIENAAVVDELALLELAFEHSLNAEGVAVNALEVLLLDPFLQLLFGEARVLAARANVLVHNHASVTVQEWSDGGKGRHRWLVFHLPDLKRIGLDGRSANPIRRLVSLFLLLDLVVILALLVRLHLAREQLLGRGAAFLKGGRIGRIIQLWRLHRLIDDV